MLLNLAFLCPYNYILTGNLQSAEFSKYQIRFVVGRYQEHFRNLPTKGKLKSALRLVMIVTTSIFRSVPITDLVLWSGSRTLLYWAVWGPRASIVLLYLLL